MRFKKLETKSEFFSRNQEIEKIRSIVEVDTPSILAVYGRRRVGKSELIAQALSEQNVVKIEGIQGCDELEQIGRALKQLSYFLEDPDMVHYKMDSWFEYFDLFVRKADFTKPFVLYLEELQWLADYSSKFISDLKYFWDNHLQYKKGFHLILCGSSPSFMISEVINSAALYNRSQNSIHLKPFTFKETREYLGERYPSLQVMDAYLTLGGIPEYLNYLKKNASVILGVCKNSFIKDSFFTKEYERIFVSSLKNTKNYQKIIEFLAKTRFASREEILKYLTRQSGGDISEILEELILTSFINSYAPYFNKNASKLIRYEIADPYLQFYYKFIRPLESNIDSQVYDKDPGRALNLNEYAIWLGYQFERWCRNNHNVISKQLGFESVSYKHGAFFSRQSEKESPGFQWDLVFDRKDKVLTLCEVKYLKTSADISIATEFESKLSKFPKEKLKGYAIEKVLITSLSPSQSLVDLGFFDRVLVIDDFL